MKQRQKAKALGVVVLTIAAMSSGCKDESATVDLDTSRPTDFGYQVTPKTVLLIEGKQAYETYCIGCHGAEGNGKGEAARFLNPRPRDFQKAEYKFMSRRFGDLPTDEDLFRSISTGLRGSAMPAWGHLPERKRWALVEYIKSFSDVWDRTKGSEIPIVTNPYAELDDKSEAIARGEVAYHGFFTCWNCHPAYVPTEKINEYLQAMGMPARSVFRDHLEQTAIKSDSSGETIFAPDFLRDYVKSAVEVEDLYRVIGAGITGTAMPVWIDAVPDQATRDEEGNLSASKSDIWAMAYYVQELMKRRAVKFDMGQVVVRDDRALRFGEDHAMYVAQVADASGDSSGGDEEFLDDEEEFFDEDEE